MIQRYRIDHGLGSLVSEEILNVTAEKYAHELQLRNRISHVDIRGNRVLDRYKANGGTAVEAGEILGTSRDCREIFSAWQSSETHNNLMLDPKWTRMAATVVETDGIYIAVVLFSVSAIEDLSQLTDNETVRLTIDSIKDKKLYFPNWVSFIEKPVRSDGIRVYELSFAGDTLPVIVSVLNESNGEKKMSDFLYIEEIKLFKNH